MSVAIQCNECKRLIKRCDIPTYSIPGKEGVAIGYAATNDEIAQIRAARPSYRGYPLHAKNPSSNLRITWPDDEDYCIDCIREAIIAEAKEISRAIPY